MIPAKAGTTNGLRLFMQFPSERGKRVVDTRQNRLEPNVQLAKIWPQ